MTLLQELQATIRAKSSSDTLPFVLAVAAMPSNAPQPEVSPIPPHGRSSHASVRLSTGELDEIQRRSVRIAGRHSCTEVSYREGLSVFNDLNG